MSKEFESQPARQVGGEGSAAQKSFWAGFEAASMSKSSNIREAWNQYKATDEFARLSRCAALAPAAVAYRLDGQVIRTADGRYVAELMAYDASLLRALLGKGGEVQS